MSFIIDSALKQQVEGDYKQDYQYQFDYIHKVIKSSLEQIQNSSKKQIKITNIQIVNVQSKQTYFTPNFQFFNNRQKRNDLNLLIILLLFSQKSLKSYQIYMEVNYNYFSLQNTNEYNCYYSNDIIYSSSKSLNSQINPDVIKQNLFSLSCQLKINNVNFLNEIIFSQRQKHQILNLIKVFNIFSTFNFHNNQHSNLKMFLSQTGNLCLSSTKLISFNENQMKIYQKQKHNKILKEYWKQLLLIAINFSQFSFNVNNENFQQKNLILIKQMTFQNTISHQISKDQIQLHNKFDQNYKQSLFELSFLRKSFLHVKNLKVQVQKSSNLNHILQKNLRLIIPQLSIFKKVYRLQLNNSIQNNKNNKQDIYQNKQQIIIDDCKKKLHKKYKFLKNNIKNKLVHGIILIDHQNSSQSNLPQHLVFEKKFKSQVQFLKKVQIEKEIKKINNYQNQLSQKSKQKSSSSSVFIQGCGQSLIKKLKKNVFLVNTIFKLRKLYSQSTKQILKKGQHYQKLYKQKQALSKQKIEICQYFAQKSAILQNKSSVESFCSEYAFLKQFSDQYCKHVAKYYLDVGQQQANKNVQQRKIYSKWQKSDFYQGIYKKLVKQEKNTISNQNLLQLCSQMIESLCFLNKIKIVHRDIKMSNFLISKNMTIKLTDFGSCYPQFYSMNFNNNQGKGQINQIVDEYSKRVRTSYGLTYNSEQLTPQIRSKYTKQQYNTNINFDIHSLGIILKQILYKNVQVINCLEVRQNIQFLCENCLQLDPNYRLMAFEVFVILKKIIKLKKQYTKILQHKICTIFTTSNQNKQ